jgi:hypothetical protein
LNSSKKNSFLSRLPAGICPLAQDEASRPEVECASDACKISSIQLMREGIRTLCQVAHSVNRHLGPFMNISQSQKKIY